MAWKLGWDRDLSLVTLTTCGRILTLPGSVTKGVSSLYFPATERWCVFTPYVFVPKEQSGSGEIFC